MQYFAAVRWLNDFWRLPQAPKERSGGNRGADVGSRQGSERGRIEGHTLRQGREVITLGTEEVLDTGRAILWIDSHPDMGTGETLDPNSIRTHWCRPAVEAVLEQRTGQLPGDHRDRHRDRASARPHGVLTNSDDATAGPVW